MPRPVWPDNGALARDGPQTEMEMTGRANILFLMSDEHRVDVAGFAGDGVVRTPVLDELARTGVVFRNAYAPSPICVPGRQCMMAGQLPRTCGCEGWIDLPPSHVTFTRHFSQYAYETICCGKLHDFGADMMQGWTQRPVGDLHVGPRVHHGPETPHPQATDARSRGIEVPISSP